jgi:hypothetical protein
MEKDNPQPKTQSSGNKPPPRPPNHTAVSMLPPDEGPEKNQRHLRKENVRINLKPKPSAEPAIQLPLLPGGSTLASKEVQPGSTDAALLILAVWAFIGAAVTMMLTFIFVNDGSILASPLIFFVLLLLWAIPAPVIRNSMFRAGKQKPHSCLT